MVIYLDHNATTPPSPAVIAAVRGAMEEAWANPSSVHRAGQAARQRVELARKEVALLLGVPAREIVFTSGGTEAIDLGVRGVLGAAEHRSPKAAIGGRGGGTPPVVVSSRVEHAAVRDLLEALEKNGEALVRWAPVDEDGRVKLGELGALLDGATLAVFQWANNETGVVQPIEEIAEACRGAGVTLLCDGVQWVGKEETKRGGAGESARGGAGESARGGAGENASGGAPAAPGPGPVASSRLPCDLLAISAHKFNGPKGAGALWGRRGVGIVPRIHGTQEMGRRGGTENVPGIVGMGAAAQEARGWLSDGPARTRLRALRDRFEGAVLRGAPGSVVNSAAAPRLWNTTNIAFPGLEAEAILLMLSERGVCASAGAACSSGSLEPSPVLLAMGIPERLAHGSVRFSLGRETTEAEVHEAAGIVVECVARLS